MRKKLFYLKYFLWWLGIIKKCPKCGSVLINVDKGGWDLYKCSSTECDFGRRRIHFKLEIWKR